MRHWRKMTWTIWGWTILCAIWLATGIASVANSKASCSGLSQSECSAARDVGAGIGVTFIIIIWLIVFLVLSIVWFMTRPKGRVCPQCGENVPKGQTLCRKCGYDFAAHLRAGGAAPG
jgi:ribosomal protein L40E